MSAGALIKRFGQEVTIHRDTNIESTTKGKRNPDVYETFKITASIQPFDPDQTVEELVGAERNKHGIRVYSKEELKSVDTVNSYKADLVEYDGELFEVTKVSKWVRNKRHLTHYKSIAMRANNPGVK